MTAQPTELQLPAVKILIVDDDRAICEYMQTLLERDGYSVKTSSDPTARRSRNGTQLGISRSAVSQMGGELGHTRRRGPVWQPSIEQPHERAGTGPPRSREPRRVLAEI